jgi:hypothetical protein
MSMWAIERPADDGMPLLETLTFAIPSTTSLRKFAEVKTRFHLDAVRVETAAIIAFERLCSSRGEGAAIYLAAILVPR